MGGLPSVFDRMALDGKVAVVTGSGRGLGKAMAIALAQAGADLVLISRTPVEIEEAAQHIEKMGRKALAFRADVTLPDEVDEVVKQTMDLFGRIDILVNNVGTAIVKPLEAMTLQEWWNTLDTNLTSLFLFCRAVGPPMIAQGRGKIITIASNHGASGEAGWVAHCASKGGVIQFTKALAVEWAKYNIQVNAIGPGIFDTKSMAPILWDAQLGSARRMRIPLGREGRPDELGPLVVYLASSASDFMTGETLFIDGGELAKL
jgi:NAD(P)-dependent dehydrogenase (short-subunit alcohol dehydrogenase family)